MGGKSQLLLESAFAWAREVHPIQPLTACGWIDHDCPLSQFIMELSDVVSFHSYFALEGFRRNIAICRRFGRPLLCTEWLDRGNGNTIEDILPVLHEERIAGYHWGLGERAHANAPLVAIEAGDAGTGDVAARSFPR